MAKSSMKSSHPADLLTGLLVIQIVGLCSSFLAGGERNKPNIVLMVADDLGWNDVGYHGSEINTPNIDHLAKSGIRLENYYVQPMCSPSRAALLSGRYPIHTGLQHEVIYAGQRSGLPLEIKTLAQQLKDHGYDSHGIGKWHLGFYKNEYLPVQRGFDSWKGYLTGNEDYYTHSSCGSLGCGYDFRANNSIDYIDNGTYSTLTFTERAREIITEHNAEKPLFLYMPYQAVHFPMQAPESYIKPYQYISDNNRRVFAGMAACMDESIGNVTRYLKERGMWNNTILIFTTDNGGETSRGGNNWPLRGKKWTLWEGGIHGAAFVHSPLLNLSEGIIHRSLMHISDWYPTILEGILGETLPANLSLDGFNLWDSIKSGDTGPRTEILHNIDPLMPHPGDALYPDTFPSNTTAAIRVGDWKLLTGYPGVDSWFPPFHNAVNKHAEWLQDYIMSRHANRSESEEEIFKRYVLHYDNIYHFSYDPPLNHTIERYDAVKWDKEVKEQLKRMDTRMSKKPNSTTQLKKNVWLFNITADPEEIIDLSETYKDVVKDLLDRLAAYNLTAVPPNFPRIDPAAAPKRNNGSWSPWVGGDESESPGIVSNMFVMFHKIVNMLTW